MLFFIELFPTTQLASCPRLFGSFLYERTSIVIYAPIFYSDDVAVTSKGLLLLNVVASIKEIRGVCLSSHLVDHIPTFD